MPGIFLSYRREDAGGHAGRVYDQLQEHFGAENVFRDIDTILPGADFVEHIDTAISSADVVLALIGRDWISAAGPSGQRRLDDPEDYVRLELEAALRRGIPLIPVLVRNATMPRRQELPPGLEPLTRRHAFELPDQHWPFAIKALLAALERHVSPHAEGATEEEEPRRRSFLTRTRALVTAGAALAALGAIALIVGLGRDDVGGGDGGTGAAAYFDATDDPEIGEGRIDVEGTAVEFTAEEEGKPLVVAARSRDVRDVRMSARVRRMSGGDYRAGFLCRYVDRRNYYMLMVFSEGNYRIMRYHDGKAQELGAGVLDASVADAAEIEAQCAGDDPTSFTLTANGETVTAQDDDDPIRIGRVGIRVGTGPESSVTVRFDDLACSADGKDSCG